MTFYPSRVIAMCALIPWLTLSQTPASAQTIALAASSVNLYNNAASQAWAWTPPNTGYCGVFYCNGQDNSSAWAVVSLPPIEPGSLDVSADSTGVDVKLKATATQAAGAEAARLSAQVKIPVSTALQPFTRYRVTLNLSVANTSAMTTRLGLGQKGSPVPDVTASTFTLNTGTHCTRPSTLARVCAFDVVYTGAQASPGNSVLWFAPSTFGFDAKITGIKIETINSDPLRHHRTNLSSGSAVGTKLPANAFGFTINRWDSTSGSWPNTLGAGLLRIWDNGTYWARLEPTQGNWSNEALERLDRFVNMAAGRNPTAEVVITLGITPPWATNQCGNSVYNAPESPACSGAPTTAAQREAWKNYVRTLASRYYGKVRNFELWNEPDVMFSGTHQDLVNLAADTRAALNSVSSNHFRLIAPSTTSNGTELLDGFLAKGGGQYVDVIGHHSYYSVSDVERKISADTANVYFRMVHHGVASKPIWNTEGAPECSGNTGLNCTSSDQSPSVEAQRSLHIRTMAAHLANGVSNFSYYHLEGASEDATLRQWLALSRKLDGSPQVLTPLGQGFARSAGWLLNKGATDAWSQPASPLRVMRLGTSSTPDNGALVWNTGATAQTVLIPAGSWGLWCTSCWLRSNPVGKATFADGTEVTLSKLPYTRSNKTVQLVVPAYSAIRLTK